MKVTMLDGGSFTSAAGIWRRGEDLGRQMRFPIPVYLIEAGEERILVDTGLHPGAAADAAARYDGAESIGNFRLELSAPIDDLDAQLASAERLRALRDAGAVVRPGHDPAVLVPGPVPVGTAAPRSGAASPRPREWADEARGRGGAGRR